MSIRVLLVVLAVLSVSVFAQDPAQGWLGYATATCPPGTKITHIEAKWNVGSNPRPSSAFYSPWFGVDTSDNLNLLQPVNPWLGSGWEIYTEYYQWSPTNNVNSRQYGTKAGNQLYGQITYNGDSAQSYTITQKDTVSGSSSSQVVPVQKNGNAYKNYTIMYFVYEKVAACADYPAEGIVTFQDISVTCNNVQIAPTWTTSYVENVCNFRAHGINATTVSITWDTSAKDPTPEQFARSKASGHLRRH